MPIGNSQKVQETLPGPSPMLHHSILTTAREVALPPSLHEGETKAPGG